jgi:hypothetical protein
MGKFQIYLTALVFSFSLSAKITPESKRLWDEAVAKHRQGIDDNFIETLSGLKPSERKSISAMPNSVFDFSPQEAAEAAAENANNGINTLNGLNSGKDEARTCPAQNPLLSAFKDEPRRFGDEDYETDADGHPLEEELKPGAGTPSTQDVIKMLTSYFPAGNGNYNMETLGKNGKNLFCETANAILEGKPHPPMSELPDANTHCETAVYLSTLKILVDRKASIDKAKYGCDGSRGSFSMPPMFAKLQKDNDEGFKQAFVDTGFIPEHKKIQTDQTALKAAMTEGKPKAGDPLYIGRLPSGGHSVIFSHFEMEGEKISKLCYWSSNKKHNIGNAQSGYGERCEDIEGKHSQYHYFHLP